MAEQVLMEKGPAQMNVPASKVKEAQPEPGEEVPPEPDEEVPPEPDEE